MSDDRGMSRRHAIGISAASLASCSCFDDILAGPVQALAATGPGPTEGIGYFARFGVTEKMIRDALGARSRGGGDYADLFFQHRVPTASGSRTAR